MPDPETVVAQRDSTPSLVPDRMRCMRAILGKALHLLGALACLFALVLGLGVTPSGHGSVFWEIVLLVSGLVFLLSGSVVQQKDAT